MKTRVINLTAHEAAAFQRGATMLVREVKPQPQLIEGRVWVWPEDGIKCKVAWPKHYDSSFDFDDAFSRHAPYQPGDLLIGREAWFSYEYVDYIDGMMKTQVVYRADGEEYRYRADEDRWRSAARMPANLARVRRIVESVSLKRCQDLTEGEIEAIGYDFRECNAKLWAENKFVWVTKVKEEA